jgi:E3 ubiquitin-protein ligase SHPRH
VQVDRLVRHLRYWHLREPEVKHIIFSSWKDALTIVQAALSANDISWLSRTGAKNDTSVQRFNENPAITAFCLNGERENSGLTLTSASVCHLLEPVINSGFEMQGKLRTSRIAFSSFLTRACVVAIGRVDRVGQVRETTVYW